jgi:HAD superfamily phosphatase (TIGR01668 family)
MSRGKFCLIAKYSFKDIIDIEMELLVEQGIRFLMLDLDNTIAAYNETEPSEPVLKWFEKLKASEIKPFIISNSTRTDRVEGFAKALDIGFIMRAGKPSPNSPLKAMQENCFEPSESALIGDQTFTDVLSANLAGVIPILVRPKGFTNVYLALRYYFEVPIRLLCKNKH